MALPTRRTAITSTDHLRSSHGPAPVAASAAAGALPCQAWRRTRPPGPMGGLQRLSWQLPADRQSPRILMPAGEMNVGPHGPGPHWHDLHHPPPHHPGRGPGWAAGRYPDRVLSDIHPWISRTGLARGGSGVHQTARGRLASQAGRAGQHGSADTDVKGGRGRHGSAQPRALVLRSQDARILRSRVRSASARLHGVRRLCLRKPTIRR